jgi:nucleoside 2-deoxyribosyltransferase
MGKTARRALPLSSRAQKGHACYKATGVSAVSSWPPEDLAMPATHRAPGTQATAAEPLRAYLAGPDVFLQDAARIAASKRRLCAKYGVIALCPEDADPSARRGTALVARAIAAANEALIRRCDFVIANCSPFRGLSLDPGTAFEIGYARALGKPVFGYSSELASYRGRALRYRRLGDPLGTDAKRSRIEDFGLADNLMIATNLRGLVRRQGGCQIAAPQGFARCLALAVKTLRAAGGPDAPRRARRRT